MKVKQIEHTGNRGLGATRKIKIVLENINRRMEGMQCERAHLFSYLMREKIDGDAVEEYRDAKSRACLNEKRAGCLELRRVKLNNSFTLCKFLNMLSFGYYPAREYRTGIYGR